MRWESSHVRSGWTGLRPVMGCALASVIALAGCAKQAPEERRPEQVGQPMSSVDVMAKVAAIRGAAATGNQEVVRENVAEFNNDFRKSIKLADSTRSVDREAARLAARKVAGVRSVVSLDGENLFVIVDSNSARSYQTIDQLCIELESLGNTLGVVVNLQSGAARNGDELEILSRNCQLQPGDRALLSRNRNVDVIDPGIRAQHRANQVLSQQSEQDLTRQKESLRALEANTPALYD